MPLIHHYETTTREYTGSMRYYVAIPKDGEPQPDMMPEEPLPPDTTLIAPPPSRIGFTIVFYPEDEEWRLVEDHRGELWWEPGTGQSVFVTDIGDPLEMGLIDSVPVTQETLEQPEVPTAEQVSIEADKEAAVIDAIEEVEANRRQ